MGKKRGVDQGGRKEKEEEKEEEVDDEVDRSVIVFGDFCSGNCAHWQQVNSDKVCCIPCLTDSCISRV